MTSGQDRPITETFKVEAEEVLKKLYNDGDPEMIEFVVKTLELLKKLYDIDPDVRELVDRLADIELNEDCQREDSKTWYHEAKDEIESFLAKIIAKPIVDLVSKNLSGFDPSCYL
jgi:hypothetical protein